MSRHVKSNYNFWRHKSNNTNVPLRILFWMMSVKWSCKLSKQTLVRNLGLCLLPLPLVPFTLLRAVWMPILALTLCSIARLPLLLVVEYELWLPDSCLPSFSLCFTHWFSIVPLSWSFFCAFWTSACTFIHLLYVAMFVAPLLAQFLSFFVLDLLDLSLLCGECMFHIFQKLIRWMRIFLDVFMVFSFCRFRLLVFQNHDQCQEHHSFHPHLNPSAHVRTGRSFEDMCHGRS